MGKIISIMEAEQNGVSMENVKVCRDIRNLATIDIIKLDETLHKS